jgi:sugar O-acyltransferase (sialic acid O-acetyltransferase NeuD family)
MGETYRLVGFVDDTPEKQGTGVGRHPVLSREALVELPDSAVLAVPGSSTSYRSRRAIIEGLEVNKDRFACVIHPTARVSPMAVLGWNVLLMAGVIITSNAVIGRHVCVLPNTVIHHDAVIGDWSLIGSNVTIAGHVRVGKNCYIGSGCSIMNGVQVGDGALLGLGSIIIRDVPAGAKIVGNPGRQIA